MRARAESSQLRIASRQSRLPLQPTNPTTDTTAANPPFNPPPPAPTWTETPQYQQYQYPQQHQLQNQYQYQQHAQPQPNGQSYNPALRQSLPSHASGLSHENTSIQPIQAGTHPINTLPAGSHHPHSSLPLSADPSLLSPSAYPPQPPQPPQRPSSLLSRSSPPQTLQVSSSSRSPRRSRGLLSEFIR